MSSEKPKQKRDEERLYEPIREFLQIRFARFYVEHEKRPVLQSVLIGRHEENPYLVVKGTTKRFPEILKKEFEDDTLNIITREGIFPDILGYVQKKPKNQKEIITVEVKDERIKLKHIAQAKFYQDVFNATFGLLVSSKEIPTETVRLVLNSPLGRSIREKVIIAQAVEKRWGAQYADRRLMVLEIDSRFKDSVPEPFKGLCKQ